MLELLRASNLPTVWTNVLVGLVLSGLSHPRAWLAFPALSFIYLGGMALNDCCDATWDRQHRPDKPIPGGRIPLWQAAMVAMLLLSGGAVLLDLAGGRWGLALVGAVVAYNLVHKRTALAALLMGLCRGMVYLCVAGTLTPELLGAAALLTGYTTLLTLLARREAFRRLPGGGLRWLELALLACLVAVVVSLVLAVYSLAFYATLLLAALARARHFAGRADIRSMVLTLIAAISLLDACLLAAAGHAAWPGLVGFLATRVGHRSVSGT